MGDCMNSQPFWKERIYCGNLFSNQPLRVALSLGQVTRPVTDFTAYGLQRHCKMNAAFLQ